MKILSKAEQVQISGGGVAVTFIYEMPGLISASAHYS
jgi:hypothetical protein